MRGFVVSFIAPHSLTARTPAVAPDDQLIVHNRSREEPVDVTVDGRPICVLDPADSLEARCEPPRGAGPASGSSAGPVVVVNGPIARAIGMNSGVNALGQGNRANATIGRALQLVIRNVGGGRPGEVDRATLGNPGKFTFCFAEDEDGSPWEPLHVERGVPAEHEHRHAVRRRGRPRRRRSALAHTRVAGAHVRRAACATVAHPKLPLAFDAMLVVSPEHGRVFRGGGVDARPGCATSSTRCCSSTADELVRGAGGIAEGMPDALRATCTLPKFRAGGLLIVHAGGGAGLFSAHHRRLGERRDGQPSP